jgi:hypothetical protein
MTQYLDKIAISVILILIGILLRKNNNELKSELRTEIDSLKKGQEDIKRAGENRVNVIRDDLRSYGIKLANHETKLAVMEKTCEMKHQVLHNRRRDDPK